MDPVALYSLVGDVLAAVRARSDLLLPERLRFQRVAVVNGPASLDGIDCLEHLVAWPEVMLPTDLFPAPPVRAILCNPPAQNVQIVVQSLRCEPVLDGGGFPDPAERDAAARLVYADAQIAWNAVVCWALETDRDTMMVSGAPVPPSLVAGWETRIQVEIEACDPCGDTPFPDGFLDALT